MPSLDQLLGLSLSLAASPALSEPLPRFRRSLSMAGRGFSKPVDRALIAGVLADRLGHAFAGGYAAALHALVPDLPDIAWACLCVTEAGGGHPRAMLTTVRPEGDQLVLDGEKSWATLAGAGDTLLVVASAGWERERNLLRLVRVPVGAPGVRCVAMPETPFTPEVPHYSVTLTDVRVPADAGLPGDGYRTYVKPFRTVEDIHVCAATTGYLLGVAVRGRWDGPWVARLLALVTTLRSLADADADAPSTHLAVEGALVTLNALVAETAGVWVSGDAAARWRRDIPLLGIAGRARRQRLEQALATVFGAVTVPSSASKPG